MHTVNFTEGKSRVSVNVGSSERLYQMSRYFALFYMIIINITANLSYCSDVTISFKRLFAFEMS